MNLRQIGIESYLLAGNTAAGGFAALALGSSIAFGGGLLVGLGAHCICRIAGEFLSKKYPHPAVPAIAQITAIFISVVAAFAIAMAIEIPLTFGASMALGGVTLAFSIIVGLTSIIFFKEVRQATKEVAQSMG